MAGWTKTETGLAATGGQRLERSCSTDDTLVTSEDSHGIERIEARFYGNRFSPHRHDTYALGLTLSGVQTFSYRGASRFSLPGNVIVLHPDEVHDGSAGTDAGLRYRMMYVPPEQVQAASQEGAVSLPFVSEPVLDDARLAQALGEALADLDTPIGDLAYADLMARIADGLGRNAGAQQKIGPRAERAVRTARAYLRDNVSKIIWSEELEAVTDLNRYSLAREFRLATGTSPHRYQIMRRLENAKRLMLKGVPLAETAAEVGFADQSHLTRHFKASYGITPGRWLSLTTGQPSIHSH